MRLPVTLLIILLLALPSSVLAGEFVRQVNHARVERDLERVAQDHDWKACADRAARRFRRQGYIEHPTSCAQRIANEYGLAGENLAMAWSIKRCIRAFLRHPSHRTVLLGDWDYITVGSALDREGYTYFVVLFH